MVVLSYLLSRDGVKNLAVAPSFNELENGHCTSPENPIQINEYLHNTVYV